MSTLDIKSERSNEISLEPYIECCWNICLKGVLISEKKMESGGRRTTDVNLVQHRFLVFHVAQSVVFCVAFCGRLSFRLHKHYTFSLESRLLPFTVSTNFHHIVFNHVSLIERTKYAWNNVMNVKSRKLTPNKTQVYHLLGAQIKNLRFGNIYFKVCHLRIVSDNTLLRLYWWTQVGMAVTI